MLKRGVLLVGHGAIPKDYPRDLATRLKMLEGQRRARSLPPTAEERELDRRIRTWPRTEKTDPYQAGLRALAAHVEPLLDGDLFAVAYNEFCAPTVEEAVEDLINRGAQSIAVISSMLTPGGSHAEIDIPESLERLRLKYPSVPIQYAWPFDLSMVAALLVGHLDRCSR